MAFLLDTDVVSFVLRGRFALAERVRRVGRRNLRLSRVTVAELMVLVHRGTSAAVTAETVARVSRRLPIVEVGEAAWELFAPIKADLYAIGRAPGPTGQLDILQACVAIAGDLTLVTHNRRHFDPIAQVSSLRVEDWVDDPDS